MGCSRAASHSIALLAGALLCAILVHAVAASPLPTRENIPYNAAVFSQPEYLEAVAKELEKEASEEGNAEAEGSTSLPSNAAWWIRYQQKMQSDPTYQRDTSLHGAAAMKSQGDSGHMTRNSRNDFDGAGYAHNKKFNSHRNPDSSNSPKRFTETILYPAELIDIGNSKRNFDEIDRSGFSGFSGKRNFDEIDRSGFSGFSGKRNFDEIDRSGFSGFNKRNFDEIDRSGFSGFNKRNFDEIDRSGFSGFNKRNFDEIDRSGFSGFNKRNFDEIDRSGFSGFNKRNFDEIDRSGFSGFNKKRNFDEIDRSGFSGFNKRNFDEIDRSGFSGFNKKRNFDEIDRSGVPGFTKRSVSRSKLASRRRR